MATNYWLAMVVPYGRAVHALDPQKNRPFCEVKSEKWSQPHHQGTLKSLNRTGQPTCHYCRHALGLGG